MTLIEGTSMSPDEDARDATPASMDCFRQGRGSAADVAADSPCGLDD